jgi:hypothetical protein
MRPEMKLTTTAAKLRMTAAEMEAVAALGEDLDYPVEFVPALGVRFNWTHVSLSNGREAQHTSKKVKR